MQWAAKILQQSHEISIRARHAKPRDNKCCSCKKWTLSADYFSVIKNNKNTILVTFLIIAIVHASGQFYHHLINHNNIFATGQNNLILLWQRWNEKLINCHSSSGRQCFQIRAARRFYHWSFIILHSSFFIHHILL